MQFTIICITNSTTMKKLSIIVSLLFVINTLSSQTAKSTGTTQPMVDKHASGKKIPTTVMKRFQSDYPGEQPTWALDGTNYRATFVDGSKMFGHAVAYDKNGNVLYREERLAKDAYPSGVSNYHNEKYPNDIYEVWVSESTDKAGKKRYYSNHNLETLWFDENGNYVTTAKLRN